MDTGQVTYGELKSFREKLNNINNVELVDFYVQYKENEEKNKITEQVLELFPKFQGQTLKLDFIDEDKTMAVIRIYQDEIIVGHGAYIYNYGLFGKTFDTYDEAILCCLGKKYLGDNYSINSQYLISKMLNMLK